MSNKKGNRMLRLLNLLQLGNLTFEELLERCHVSRATLRRDLAVLKGAGDGKGTYAEGGEVFPCVNYRIKNRRYYIDEPKSKIELATGQRWLTPAEAGFVLSAVRVLEEFGTKTKSAATEDAKLSGRSRYAQSMRTLAETIVKKLGADVTLSSFSQRVVMKPGRYRKHPSVQVFAALGDAVLEGLRVVIYYTEGSSTRLPEPKVVDPQRLLCYNGTWYVEAWNPERRSLRRYALDRISSVELREETTRIGASKVEENFRMDYGAFHGNLKDSEDKPRVQWAKLRFSPQYRVWAKNEIWHKEQRSYADHDGWIIEVPYSVDEGVIDYDLVGDIMRVGPEVEVLEPAELREQVKARVEATLQVYTRACQRADLLEESGK